MTHEEAVERSIEDANRLVRARGDDGVGSNEWHRMIATRMDFYLPNRPKYEPEPEEMPRVRKA